MGRQAQCSPSLSTTLLALLCEATLCVCALLDATLPALLCEVAMMVTPIQSWLLFGELLSL